MSLNFVTAINKIYPSPLSNVFLVLNEAADLSLYRNNEHIWSAGRFKTLKDIKWSPDGRMLVVQCEKKFLIYSAEEGKKLSTIERNENLICRWIKITENETLILVLIDTKSFIIKWIVNCEFELKGSEMALKLKEPIFDVQIDPENNNEILILQNSIITKFKFPFNSRFEEENCVLLISKLSKNLQTVLRVVEEVKGQFLKLLKLDDSVFIRLSEIESIKKFLLFGEMTATSSNSIELSEADVLDWKSKLKKQHAEILVSIEEVSSVIRSFSKNYPKFCFKEIDRFLENDLIELEDKSRLLQHDLAELLVWLENLVIPDVNNKSAITIKPFKPETRALELVKNLKRSNDSILERHENWLNPFNDFKLILDLEFKNLVSKINSINLEPCEAIDNIPIGFNRILLASPLILLNENGTEIIGINKDKDVKNNMILPDKYITHYFKDDQLQIICKGMKCVVLSDNETQFQSDTNVNHNPIDDPISSTDDIIFVNPLSNQLYLLVPSINASKLTIK